MAAWPPLTSPISRAHLAHISPISRPHLAHISPQEACAHVFAEARKTLPAVVLLPAVDSLLLRAEPALRATLAALIGQRPAGLPLLVLGTCAAPLQTLPPLLQAEP